MSAKVQHSIEDIFKYWRKTNILQGITIRNKEDRDMQKLESSLKNMVLVLVGVALIVGAVLAYINHLTSGPIAEKAAQSLAAGIKSVMGTEELQVAEPEEVKQEFGGKEFSFTIHKCSDKSGKQLGAAVERPLMALVVVAKVGHIPRSNTKVGFSLMSPFIKILTLLISVYPFFR